MNIKWRVCNIANLFASGLKIMLVELTFNYLIFPYALISGQVLGQKYINM